MNIYQKIHLNVLLYPHGYSVRLLLTNELLKSHTEWMDHLYVNIPLSEHFSCLP